MKTLFSFKSTFSLFFLVILLSLSVSAQNITLQKKRQSTNIVIQNLEKDIPNLMKEADILGLSAALIQNGKIVWIKGFGFSNADTKEPVTNETVFEAASLTKVVFTYGVLKLVDEGKLDLDVPLNKYLGNNWEIGDDARINSITARHVLTHSAGFPNWRSSDSKTLPINFTPGEKFSYSGEGFVYLSAILEKITGMKLEDYMQTKVFKPLGMTNSSFLWQEKFEKTGAYRHDLIGNKLFRNQATRVNAAASLRTTAQDYAVLLTAILNGKGLKKKTLNEMIKTQIKVEDKSPELFWGLGIGLEVNKEGKSIWHWGDNGDIKACFAVSLPKKDGIVYFANSYNGLSVTKEILDIAIGGKHPALSYLNYSSYKNNPARDFLKTVINVGAVKALQDYHQKVSQDGKFRFNENRMNTFGYTLLRMKKIDDAIEIFKQNTYDYPDSANAWDSLAEGLMTKGDKESAIKYYEKSLQLNPDNTNAIEQLRKLKS